MSDDSNSNYLVNFSKTTTDASIACYLTDYLISIVTFYCAYQHIQFYKGTTDFNFKNGTLSPSEIYRKYFSFCWSRHLIFSGLATIFAGIEHQFKADEQKLTFIWNMAGFCVGMAFVTIAISPFMFGCQNWFHNSKLFGFGEVYQECAQSPDHLENFEKGSEKLVKSCTKKYYIIMGLGLILAIEELQFQYIGFDKLLFAALLIMLLASILISFKSKSEKNYVKINLPLAVISIVTVFVYVYFYIAYLHEGCTVPKAYPKTCLFPDWFNHNAVLHSLLALMYLGVSKSIIIK